MTDHHPPVARPRRDRTIAIVTETEARRATWPADSRVQMAQLSHRFPALAGAPGAAPWDPEALLVWLCGPGSGGGAVHAGCFLLSVWNARVDWTAEARARGLAVPYAGLAFNAVLAVGTWDAAHLEAFQAWVRAPWWP